MRISDWSSDVCSSDLISGHLSPVYTRGDISQVLISGLYVTNPDLFFDDLAVVGEVGFVHVNGVEHVASSPDRKSVVWGKSVSVRVDLGGRRIIKKKNNQIIKHHNSRMINIYK